MSIELLEGKAHTGRSEAGTTGARACGLVRSGTHRKGLSAGGSSPKEAGREDGRGSWRRERTGLGRGLRPGKGGRAAREE